jgi:hypothetical protein
METLNIQSKRFKQDYSKKNERSEKVAPVTPTKYHPTPADIAMNITAGTK